MPISESYNPLNNPVFNRAFKRSDIIKKFVSPASSISGGGNGVTSLDDPTYLGFSLRFDISSPLFNGGVLSEIKRPQSDSSFLDAVSASISGRGQNDDDSSTRDTDKISFVPGESAVNYLKKIGEHTKANYLKMFLQGIREVNEFRPYYWQTIDGLTEAWGKQFNLLDPYVGTTTGEGITIGCLEAIDLKISALFNLYKSAIYDAEYRRIVLPKNLMYFNVEVDVHEIRRFKFVQTWLSRINEGQTIGDVDRFLNDNTSKITFAFEDCLWVPSESGKVFENVTNAGDNTVTVTSMKWEYSNAFIKSDFSGIDVELNDKLKDQDKGKLGDFVKNAAKNQATKAANAVLNRAESRIRGAAQSTVLGNAFGLRNQVLNFIRDPGALAGAIEGALFQRRSTERTVGDNPLRPTPQAQASLNSTNIFSNRPSGPGPLNSNNVFE